MVTPKYNSYNWSLPRALIFYEYKEEKLAKKGGECSSCGFLKNVVWIRGVVCRSAARAHDGHVGNGRETMICLWGEGHACTLAVWILSPTALYDCICLTAISISHLLSLSVLSTSSSYLPFLGIRAFLFYSGAYVNCPKLKAY
jgi:hypothetical protein